jgi:hypothetical protein
MFTLLRRYWDDLVSYDGGMSLLMMDGLLLVPLIMAAFFYPLQVGIAVVAVLIVTLAVYEGVVFWRKHHPHAHI